MGGLINFGGLEELIHGVVDNHRELSAQVQRLETTLSTMASKEHVQEIQQALADSIASQGRQVERLDLSQKTSQPIIDEVPMMQRDITDRMTNLEQKVASELNNTTFSLNGRIKTVESDMRTRASLTEMRKLSAEVEERAKREELRALQEQVIKVRDHSSERIDDIGERTYNMRREMDERVQELRAASDTIQKEVHERTARLEDQSREVSTFLAKAERAINTKVTTEDLAKMQTSFSEQLHDCRSVLQAQMIGVRERAETIYTEFQEGWKNLQLVAYRKDVEPVAELARDLSVKYAKLAELMALKAEEMEVKAQFERVFAELAEHGATIETKADAADTQERHDSHVAETATSLQALSEGNEHLGISVNSLQEQVGQVSTLISSKAERHEVDEIVRMNEAVQEQVVSLKSDLQGTLKALETWIFEQNTRKSHSLKLQRKSSTRSKLPTDKESVVSGDGGGDEGAKEPEAGGAADGRGGVSESVHLKLQKRVEELERTLYDTQQLLEMRMLNPSVVVDDALLAASGASAASLPKARPRKLDDSGMMMVPVNLNAGANIEAYSPRQRRPGGVMAPTLSSQEAQTRKYTQSMGEEDAGGPPFRSQGERRQWLLQEKRRWLVEMRLGKAGDAYSGATSSPRLPPLLSNGAQVDTIATPR